MILKATTMDDNIWEYPFGDILEDDDDMFCQKQGLDAVTTGLPQPSLPKSIL
jgi:hypothetical protein